MDLINRDHLLREMNDWQYGEMPFLVPNDASEYTAQDVQIMIYRTIKDAMLCVADQPKVEAVQIVRCKDCMNWDLSWIPRYYKDGHYCPFIDLVTDGEFYCSYAERKTNNGK